MTARLPIDRSTPRLRVAGPDSYEISRRLSVAILRTIPDAATSDMKNETAADNERIIRQADCTVCGAVCYVFGEPPDGPPTSVVTFHAATCATLPPNRAPS